MNHRLWAQLACKATIFLTVFPLEQPRGVVDSAVVAAEPRRLHRVSCAPVERRAHRVYAQLLADRDYGHGLPVAAVEVAAGYLRVKETVSCAMCE